MLKSIASSLRPIVLSRLTKTTSLFVNQNSQVSLDSNF